MMDKDEENETESFRFEQCVISNVGIKKEPIDYSETLNCEARLDYAELKSRIKNEPLDSVEVCEQKQNYVADSNKMFPEKVSNKINNKNKKNKDLSLPTVKRKGRRRKRSPKYKMNFVAVPDLTDDNDEEPINYHMVLCETQIKAEPVEAIDDEQLETELKRDTETKVTYNNCSRTNQEQLRRRTSPLDMFIFNEIVTGNNIEVNKSSRHSAEIDPLDMPGSSSSQLEASENRTIDPSSRKKNSCAYKKQSEDTNKQISNTTSCPEKVKNSLSRLLKAAVEQINSDANSETTANRKRKVYSCDICDVTCANSSNLIRHRRTHTGEKPYTCEICNQAFARSAHLARHKMKHTGERPFGCDLCGKRFGEARTLVHHRRIHTGEKPYVCDVCEKAFSRAAELNIHARLHTDDRPYDCNICGRSYSRSGDLTFHKKTFHSYANPYKCDRCGITFLQAKVLDEHIRYHNSEKPFSCSVCAKTFSRVENLNVHKRIHSGEKPYCCGICGKSFIGQKVLNEHIKTHTGEKPFSCDICGNRFSQSSSLNKHKKRIHLGAVTNV